MGLASDMIFSKTPTEVVILGNWTCDIRDRCCELGGGCYRSYVPGDFPRQLYSRVRLITLGMLDTLHSGLVDGLWWTTNVLGRVPFPSYTFLLEMDVFILPQPVRLIGTIIHPNSHPVCHSCLTSPSDSPRWRLCPCGSRNVRRRFSRVQVEF